VKLTKAIHLVGACLAFLIFSRISTLSAAPIQANVKVIIDKLPIEKQEKMREFDQIVKAYIERASWFEEEDQDIDPIIVSVQFFLQDSPSNVEDRYLCEFLISSSDIQYYDRRMKFAYQPGERMIFDAQGVTPLTGVIDFYVYLVIANEFDKFGLFGGDIYFKKALSTAALGKFVRSEFILGWTERDELIKKMQLEPYPTFRQMKDHFFYAQYVSSDNIGEAREHGRIAVDMLKKIAEHEFKFDATKQFMDAHFLEFIRLFKDDKNNKAVFEKLILVDANHEDAYRENILGS
jgi:hypothetical protein